MDGSDAISQCGKRVNGVWVMLMVIKLGLRRICQTSVRMQKRASVLIYCVALWTERALAYHYTL